MSAATEIIMDCPLPIISNLDSQGETVDLTEPAIYVASLSDYNGGILHGCWISCCYGVDHVWCEVHHMLAASPYAKKYGDKAEEWAIHDYSGFEGIDISEWASFDHACELAQALEEHGEAFAAYYGLFPSNDIESCVSAFEDAFCGVYDSELDYAYELADEMIPHDAPDFLTRYFDYEAFARDLFIDGYTSARISNGYAIFRDC